MSRVLFWVAILLGIFCLVVPRAEGKEVKMTLDNAWDNTHVWARSEGINQPFTAVWESRATDGRLFESQFGQTTQLTLDDEWRIITLYAVYKGERYVQLSVKAKFKGTTPIYEVIQGDTQ